MMRTVLLGLLGSTLLGCASKAAEVRLDHSYQLEWIGERPLVDRSHLTMTLGNDGRAYGNAGCNHWFASFAQEGRRLHFGIVGSTRKVCAPALMEQEQRFLDALSRVQRWDISPVEQMQLWPEAGLPLRFWLEES